MEISIRAYPGPIKWGKCYRLVLGIVQGDVHVNKSRIVGRIRHKKDPKSGEILIGGYESQPWRKSERGCDG